MSKPKQPRGMAPRKRKSARRTRRPVQVLRPLQHQVPDLRDPRVRAAIRREAALLARHPENAAIDAWIEAVYDWSEWR